MSLFGGPPVPESKTSWEVVNDTFIYTVTGAPKQLLLMPDFEIMVHDDCLRAAHAAGKMPIGEILISFEDDQAPPPPQQLTEGVRMGVETLDQKLKRYRESGAFARDVAAGFGGAPVQRETITIKAEVFLGADLGSLDFEPGEFGG